MITRIRKSWYCQWVNICLGSWVENSVNADRGGVKMFLSPCALKSVNSIEKIQSRITCDTFNGNPSATIVSWYSSTDVRGIDVTTFFNRLSSLDGYIPKHNVLNISGDMNTQIGKDMNNKFCLPNRYNEYLADTPQKVTSESLRTTEA